MSPTLSRADREAEAEAVWGEAEAVRREAAGGREVAWTTVT